MKPRWFVLSFLVLAAILLSSALAAPPASGAEGPLAGQKICLDPGHGGSDPGAVNEAYGLYESEINLDVAFALKGLLEGDGAVVVMTRTDDSYLTNRDRYTFCNAQGATLLISVHTNSIDNTTSDGTMTLYFKSEDKVLAQAIHETLYPALWATAPDQAAFDDWGLSRFASGVLLKSDMPAAIMEPLFMSHPGEAKLLTKTIADVGLTCRRGEIAWGVYQGILSYFSGSAPTPTPEPGGTMHVVAIDMSYETKGPNVFVSTEVTIEAADSGPVPGALVAVDVTLPDGGTDRMTDITGEDGTVTFKLRSGLSGTYKATIFAVSKEGWAYDETANAATEDSVTVP